MSSPPPTDPPLEAALLRRIAERGGVKRYPAGAVVIHEGDPSTALYIVLSGRVKVYTASGDGREFVLDTHGAGEYIGELALDGRGRSASVATLEPTTCAVVGGAQFREFIVEHPAFALHLIHKLIGRLRSLTGSMKSLALDDVYGRIAALLKRLAKADADGALVIDERLTQQAIAERVGASREMVSRVFKELTVGGYVSVRAGRITLLKPLPADW